MMRANNLRIVETATVPGVPISPRVSLNVIVGPLRPLLGIGLPLLREQLGQLPQDAKQTLSGEAWGATFPGASA